MAYNPYYPLNNYPYYPQYQTALTPQETTPQPIQPTIQNGGFISVPNIDVARRYPVALGNSVTFKDENAPYVYTKTQGFSQLETPRFDVYRLVKEETATEPTNTSQNNDFALKTELNAVQEDLNKLYRMIEQLQTEKKPSTKAEKKTEVKEDA